MAIDTIPNEGKKSYEIAFEPITLTFEMRKNLFEYFKRSLFLVRQIEEYLKHDNCPLALGANEVLAEFFDFQIKIEKFVTG